MENKNRKRLIFISATIFIAALIAMTILILGKNSKQKTNLTIQHATISNFEDKLKNSVEKFGISKKNFQTSIDLEERQRTITINFPRTKLIEEFVAELFDAANNTEYKITEAKHFTKKKPEFVSIVFENKKRTNEKIFCKIIITNEISSGTASAAFIIKDLENLSEENVKTLLSFSEPLNYILTPWQQNANSSSIFSKIHSPVLIEIPIEENETSEAETKFSRQKYTIYQADSKKIIDEKIKKVLSFYPNAAGLFAKTGNLVLNSPETAKMFLQTLKTKKRNLCFLDARPLKFGKKSVCKELSEELQISYDTISISLPSKNNLSSAEWDLELKNAANKAAKSRYSVILISADNNFVPVFVKNIQYIQNKGIEFVWINHFSKGE